MRKIAIVRRNGLGDLLCAYPLIRYLRLHYPSDELTLFVDERNAPLLPYLPPPDKVVIFPSKGNKYWNLGRTAFAHRFEKYDLAICAKTSPMKLMNLFLFALGAKQRIAYVDKSWHQMLVNVPRPFEEAKAKKLHQALKGLHLIDPAMTCVPEELYPVATVSEKIKAKYSLSKLPSPILLLSATTTRLASRLDPIRYAALVNKLYEKVPFSVIVVGQQSDQERAFAIAQTLKPAHEIHFPRNFEAFMVLLDLSDLYFVGDGGIAHIGAALGKEGVVLYGETNPIEWHPLSRKVSCLYHPMDVNYLSNQEISDALTTRMGNLIGATIN